MGASVNSSLNSSTTSQIVNCFRLRTSSAIFVSWFIVYILFLPVFVSVLYIGYLRWRKQRSDSLAVPHSDVFTFHMVALEMVNTVGMCLFCRDLLIGTTNLVAGGISMVVAYGQMFFHVLTCVERYLAVVHPITYRGLKQVGGVRIRNISIGCAWLLSIGVTIDANVVGFDKPSSLILNVFFVSLCAAFTFVCSFSALCVLIRPGPGEVGRDRKLINKSKRRALNTLMTILGALSLKVIVYVVVYISPWLFTVNAEGACVITMFTFWLNLPSILVLPLLFLHRARKRPGKEKEMKNRIVIHYKK